MRIVLEYALIFLVVAGIIAIVPQLVAIVTDSWYYAVRHVTKTIKDNEKDKEE